MKNIIIALHCSHNATAGISIDGKVVCLLSEERLNRVKNSDGFPALAFDYILKTYCRAIKIKLQKSFYAVLISCQKI
ncbi:MAG: hypothetical protein LBC07_04665 [Elusimicrobiota bacterium]|jgi:predicted NodU family carbamoyl transferase|nr:hypothetical protein [Elusimicrobiota bacterium]